MLLLEVGNEFPHLVGTPASFRKSFLQGSRKTMINEKGGKGFCSGDVGWAGWQGEMNLPLHTLWCLCSLHRSWLFSSALSSEEYSSSTFLSAPPIANGFPPVSFLAVCSVHAM